MAAFPKGSDLPPSPSDGCEGIKQGRRQEMDEMTDKFGDLKIGGGESKRNQPLLQDSPSGNGKKYRDRRKAKPNWKMPGNRNLNFDLEKPAPYGQSPSTAAKGDTDTVPRTPIGTTRQKRKLESPIRKVPKKNTGKLSNLRLNLGQPPVW